MTPFDAPIPAIPLSDSVVIDQPCRKCGYNLRSLRIDSVCPECGTPVAVSIRGDWLQYCDPAWIKLLARGAKFILTGLLIYILGVIAGVILLRTVGTQYIIYGQATFLGGYAVYVFGCWLITSPDPSGIGEDRYGRARQVIRITLIFGIAGSTIDFGAARTSLPPTARQLFGIVSALFAIVSIVGIFAQLQYLESLCRRIPNEFMSRRAKFLKIYFPAAYATVIIASIAILLLGRGNQVVGIIVAIGCFVAAVGLFLLILGILYLRLIESFGKELKQQLVLATQNWNAGHHIPPPPPNT